MSSSTVAWERVKNNDAVECKGRVRNEHIDTAEEDLLRCPVFVEMLVETREFM